LIENGWGLWWLRNQPDGSRNNQFQEDQNAKVKLMGGKNNNRRWHEAREAGNGFPGVIV